MVKNLEIRSREFWKKRFSILAIGLIALSSLIIAYPIPNMTSSVIGNEYSEITQNAYGSDIHQQTVTLSSAKSTWYTSYAPRADYNCGARSDLIAGFGDPWTANVDQRSLVEFDIDSLPTNVIITNAVLKLYFSVSEKDSIATTLCVYRLTESWEEGTGTFSGPADDGATWYHSNYPVTWTSPGGTLDYVVLASRTLSAATNAYENFTSGELTAVVRGWYDGTYSNYGFLLKDIRTSGTLYARKIFHSDDATYVPKLEITYVKIVHPPPHLQTVTLSSAKSTWFTSYAPRADFNSGARSDLIAGFGDPWTANVDQRSLVEFDLDSLPTNIIITNVVLKLYFSVSEKDSIATTLCVYRLTESWEEGNGTFSGPADDGATWYHRDYPLTWTSPGGTFDSVVLASRTLSAVTNAYENFTSGELTAIVRGWHDGTYDNCGFLIKDLRTSGIFYARKIFHSDDATYVPKLEITYVKIVHPPPQTVPFSLQSGEI